MKNKLVLDASSLIHLAKAGLSTMIEKVDGEKYTVPAVLDEVVRRGRELGYADAEVVGSLIARGAVEVRAPAKTIGRFRDLHEGESDIIALAKEMKATAILDDRVARAIARLHEVRIEGTYGIILRCLAKEHISRDEARVALEKLVSSGWRCDIELYSKLLKLIDEVSLGQRGGNEV